MVDITTPAAYCPNCGTEYRAGFDTCADCGTSLLRGLRPEGWTAEPKPERDTQKATSLEGDDDVPVVLCSLPEDQAYLLSGLLTDAGIEARPTSASRFSYSHVLGGGKGNVDVLVRKEALREAAEIAKEFVA